MLLFSCMAVCGGCRSIRLFVYMKKKLSAFFFWGCFVFSNVFGDVVISDLEAEGFQEDPLVIVSVLGPAAVSF